jgi:hypothetical protein
MAKKTLKVKMLVSMAGPDESYEPGQEYDVSEHLARAFCTLPEDGPRAEPVGWSVDGEKPKRAPRVRKPKAETAAAATPETAAKPAAKPRSRGARKPAA